MKFTMSKKLLQDALKRISSAVARRSPLPVLSGVKMLAGCGRLALEATDLEITIRLQVAADTGDDESVTVSSVIAPARTFAKAVATMADEAVALSPTFLAAGVSFIGGSGPRLYVRDPLQPVLIEDPSVPDRRYVVMPVRVS